MNEKFPQEKSLQRDDVVEAFKKLKEKGINDPWVQDETTKEAWDLYNSYYKYATGEAEKNDNRKASYELNQLVSIDALIIDAGFEADEDNLDTILDFLEQDMRNAEESGDTESAEQIKGKIAIYEKKRSELS